MQANTWRLVLATLLHALAEILSKLGSRKKPDKRS